MNFSNVVNNPGCRCMAPSTIGTNCLLMNISVAFETLTLRISKNQCFVTKPAFNGLVLSNQRQCSGGVIKGVDLFIEFPPLCTMALLAGNIKALSVRGIRCQGS